MCDKALGVWHILLVVHMSNIYKNTRYCQVYTSRYTEDFIIIPGALILWIEANHKFKLLTMTSFQLHGWDDKTREKVSSERQQFVKSQKLVSTKIKQLNIIFT